MIIFYHTNNYKIINWNITLTEKYFDQIEWLSTTQCMIPCTHLVEQKLNTMWVPVRS